MSARDANSAPKRRRSFVAQRDEPVEIATGAAGIQAQEPPEDAPAPIAGDDDLPVLTEIVSAEEEEQEYEALPVPPILETPLFPPVPEMSPVAPVPDMPLEAPLEAPPVAAADIDVEKLAARMAQAINQQMAYELPTLVEAALLNVVAELRSGIASTIDVALHEFIARHEQTRSDGK
jgi:hypothetical protein